MKLRPSRRDLITGAAALAAYSQIGDAEAINRLLLLLGDNVSAPPSGDGYVYYMDANAIKQVLTYTDANGLTRPLFSLGGS